MCVTGTPIAEVVRHHALTDGWLEWSTVDVDTRAAAYFPISGTVLQFESIFGSENEWVDVAQFQVHEVHTGTAIKAPLRIYLYANATPGTAPVVGTIYQAPFANWIGTIDVAAADYKRLNDLEEIATVRASLPMIKNGTTGINSAWAVAVGSAAGGYDYAASAQLFGRLAMIPKA